MRKWTGDEMTGTCPCCGQLSRDDDVCVDCIEDDIALEEIEAAREDDWAQLKQGR